MDDKNKIFYAVENDDGRVGEFKPFEIGEIPTPPPCETANIEELCATFNLCADAVKEVAVVIKCTVEAIYETPPVGTNAGKGDKKMNKQRRQAIAEAREQIEELKSSIEEILEEEQESYDNMPESLQYSERGEAMSEAIENLESAVSSLEEATDYLDSAAE